MTANSSSKISQKLNLGKYIFYGHHLLVAKLRSSNVDPADGALEKLQRVIKLIRKKWPTTQILVRADSAYAREEIFKFCEEERGVDYAIAIQKKYLSYILGFHKAGKAKTETLTPQANPTNT